MTDQIEITLDVNNIEEIPEELYEFLLDQFITKAQTQGIDIVNSPSLCLGTWTIKAQVETVDAA